jgi:hypothetical protein
MKSTLLTACTALALAATGARADLVLIQDTAAGEVKSRTTMSISGDHVRTDNGTETSVIINTKTGQMTTLMHEQKMAMTTDLKQLQAAAAATPGASEAAVGTLTATGKTETIQGHRCEQYLSENAGTKVLMWIAKDYPNYATLKKQMSALENLSASAVKQPEVPGMALKTEFTTNGVTFTTSLVSLKEQKVDPAIFKAPAGYQALGQ